MPKKEKILIVDDSEMNRAILSDILTDKYEFLEAENGRRALDILNATVDIDLILLDITMPEMDGFAMLEALRPSHLTEEVPVIIISARDASTFMGRAYDLGAMDYINRPFDANIVRRRVENALLLYAKQRYLFQTMEQQIYEREKASDLLINILGHVMEFRNSESGSHVLHIRLITDILLRQLLKETDRYHFSESDIVLISSASALHDIGKISIPEAILNKPGKLTAEEWELMKSHTVIGDTMLQSIPTLQAEPLIRISREICRWHHERWDGKGYPDGLAGDAIPISAQVVALADVYDALTSQRCYKAAYDHDTAVQMILNGECGQFNPLLLRCFQACAGQLSQYLDRSLGQYDYHKEAKRLSEELLRKKDIPVMDRSARMLDLEREKTAFYAARCGGIQFQYDLISGRLSLTNWNEPAQTTLQHLDLEQDQQPPLLSVKDFHALKDALAKTTPDQPEVTCTVLIPVGRMFHWHRLTARTLWTNAAPPRCIEVVGQLEDVHSEMDQLLAEPQVVVRAGIPLDTVVRELSKIFEYVQLVDPVRAEILDLEEDGTLVHTGRHCCETWRQGHCCENCPSAQAFAEKTQLSRLEPAGRDLRCIIAKYVESNGTPCVLELVAPVGDRRVGSAPAETGGIRPERFYCDPLTGAYSRMYLENYLPYLEKMEGVAIIDADNFKTINDTYGHPVGDMALRCIAEAILSCIRSTDILIRYGGDEFLLLFPKIPEDIFHQRMREIHDAVHNAAMAEYPDIHMNISIGGAYQVTPLVEAIRQADKQMYGAKRAAAQQEEKEQA